MKLLFDQNISFRLIKKITVNFKDATQVRELGLENATDLQIWTFDRNNNYAIVTFDSDFYEMATYFGHPPKIIWLRTGNTNTDNLAELINKRANLISEFLVSDTYKEIACIEIE